MNLLSPGLDEALSDRLVFEQVFDNALVGICFMQDRRFVRVNRRMEELLGYAPGELCGESVRKVYARKDDFEEVGAVLHDFPESNRYVHERPLVARNGEIRWCQISGRLVDADDPLSASVWVVQDLTDKKRAEGQLAREKQRLEETIQRRTLNLQKSYAALRQEIERRRESERTMIESREKYRVLFRNLPLGLVITDAEGGIIEVNPAMQAFLGVRKSEAAAAAAAEFVCTDARDGARLPLPEAIRRHCPVDSRRIEHSALQWRSADGVERHFDVVGLRVPVRGLGAAVVFGDRTEARRAREREHAQQQQLAHATRLSLMGQFVSALAHELGQPLNACMSYAAGVEHRLHGRLEEWPEARDGLARIRLHLDQAADVIRNVRAFIAKHRPDDEAVDVKALVRATLDLLQLQLRGVEVVVRMSEEQLPTVRGNRVELQQVLVNLLVNSVEAMRDAGVAQPRLELRAARQGRGGLRIGVRDNGPGVPEASREDIFEPYFTTKAGGLGMGLMMCRTIAESHGGKLALDTRGARGASFTLTLPVGK